MEPEYLQKVLPRDALKEAVTDLLFRLDGMGTRDKWNVVEAAALAVLAISGKVEDFLPFFVGAVFRRNLALLDHEQLNVFPKSLASLQVRRNNLFLLFWLFTGCLRSIWVTDWLADWFALVKLQANEPLRKLLKEVVDDYALGHHQSVLPAITSLLHLIANPKFSSSTAFGTISVLVEVISRLKPFSSTGAAKILDCIASFLRRVVIVDHVPVEEHLEDSLSHIIKGKLSAAIVPGWCSLLWSDMKSNYNANLDGQWRAAKFVLDDVADIQVIDLEYIWNLLRDWLCDRLITWLLGYLVD